MNCIDFRREILTHPTRLGAAARDHLLSCATCQAFHERQLEFDAELYEAMRVPVSDGLADRILVAQGLRRKDRRWLWAIAATVVLAAGLAMLVPPFFASDPLGREAIAHVMEEPQSFRTVAKHAPDYLPAELASQGVRLLAALGEVTYSRLCPMERGLTARHLVVATARGPVTLLLMPDDPERHRRSVTEADGMTAITLPAAKGSITIVAADRSQAFAVERSLALS